jgi:hypothetical protein
MTSGFRHRERDRIIVSGPGAMDDARPLLPDRYTLLTTRRRAASPALDPGLSASLPPDQLAAGSAKAFGHAITASAQDSLSEERSARSPY